VTDRLGLVAGIEFEAQTFEQRPGIRSVLCLPSESVALDQDRATAVFRIFQEILTNVVRHAQAKTVGTYHTRVLHKLGLRGDVEVARYALQHKLVE
jgi:signal transduction histidine kinase